MNRTGVGHLSFLSMYSLSDDMERIIFNMRLEAQKHAPVYEALEKFRKQRIVPFDVPGHKRGRGA